MKPKIFSTLGKVKKYCTRTLNDEAVNLLNEMKAYDKAEKYMSGLPHFSDADPQTKLQDLQRSHIALLAILLTAPRYITFASPIIYLRTMRAIRKIFSNDGLFLFEINCTKEIQDQLCADNKNAIPEIIMDFFRKNNIPLSMKATFVVKNANKEWVIIDGDNHFLITIIENNNSKYLLNIRFKFPNRILKLISIIIRDTKYYFDPKKHHNHWHVDFYDEVSANFIENRNRLGALIDPISMIFIVQEVWLILGINLNPIIEYLNKHHIDENIASYLFNNPLEEKKDIQEKCQKYMDAYEKRFGNSLLKRKTANQAQNEIITRVIYDRLFGLYEKYDSEYIKPTISKDDINKPDNFEILQDPIKITREILIALKKPLIEAGLLEENDFNLFELKEPDEINDAPDEEMDDYEVRFA